MKQSLVLALILAVTVSGACAQIKMDVDRFMTLYNQGRYKQVFDECYAMRNRKEYGKTAILDYFMAKCLCGEGSFNAAKNGFDYILREYPLSRNQKKYIQDESKACQRAADASNAGTHLFNMADFRLASAPNVPVAKVSGKMGYVLDCQTDTEAYKFVPEFNRDVLQERLFEINERDKAIRYYQRYLGDEYHIAASGRYLFVTYGRDNLATKQVKDIASNLERAYTFIGSYYGSRPPDKLLAIYLLRDVANLRSTALKVHGLVLPQANIGYSSLDDLSILATYNASAIGTVFHELFHLMIRTDIGDIPAWLDEGIACVYETSGWRGNVLKGNVNNWRTDVLREGAKAKRKAPSLQTLIEENWDGFVFNDENTPCDIAMHYAVAKHFAIYMQEHNMLQRMTAAFMTRRNVFTDTSSENENGIALVEYATGMKMDALQTDFNKWMDKTYAMHEKLSPRQQFENAQGILQSYRDVDSHFVTSKEYKALEARADRIRAAMRRDQESVGNNAPNQNMQMVQAPLGNSGLISEATANEMLQFCKDVHAFAERHPAR